MTNNWDTGTDPVPTGLLTNEMIIVVLRAGERGVWSLRLEITSRYCIDLLASLPGEVLVESLVMAVLGGCVVPL